MNENSALLRHVTHCSICKHPEREAIEQAILHWYSPTVIAHEFDLADRRIVYRHADAFGLFRLRAEQSRHALGFLIEQAQSVVPSADAIIRAVRALSCIDDHGHWHEPRKEVIITHRYVALQACQKDEEAAVPLAEEDTTAPAASTERNERPLPQQRSQSSRRRERSLRAPSLSAAAGSSRDKQPASSSRVSTTDGAETERRSWSPLSLFSTRLLRRDHRNSSRINKTAKTSRHTFDIFDDAEKSPVAPAPARRC